MPPPSPPPPSNFNSLGLADPLVAAVAPLGYEEPTPTQKEAIPVLLSDADVHGTCVVALYGGAALGLQLRALKRGADVGVATPGRALGHITRRTLKLGHLRVITLDEADEMLDMGFAEDLEAILEATPKERQTALFSATMP